MFVCTLGWVDTNMPIHQILLSSCPRHLVLEREQQWSKLTRYLARRVNFQTVQFLTWGCLKKKKNYWSVINIQYYVCFRCPTQWLNNSVLSAHHDKCSPYLPHTFLHYYWLYFLRYTFYVCGLFILWPDKQLDKQQLPSDNTSSLYLRVWFWVCLFCFLYHTCEWNHMAFVFLWLSCFTHHYTLSVHPLS